MKKKLRFHICLARAAALAFALLPFVVSAGPVDINTADAKTLARELQGIGLARAQAIVEYREKNGPFKSAEDLSKIKGIGAYVIEQNRANIQIEKIGQSDKGSGKKAAKSAESAQSADAKSTGE